MNIGIDEWPRWAVMWAMAFAIYCLCKWVTWRGANLSHASGLRQAGYLLAWPGLDTAGFCSPRPLPAALRPDAAEWLFAAFKLLLGILLFYGVARWVPPRLEYMTGWVGMVGIVMTLHFGLFHLLSCAWRSAGVDARPLMNWPAASKSVSEFWGRRWNTAFRDLTHRYLFRPLVRRVGAAWALLVGFAFSGLVHDVVISAPAGGGYGRPTLFFLLQGAAMFVERGAAGRALGLHVAWRGWTFTFITLVAPACLLFHPPFVLNVVTPFMRDLGAIE